MEYLQFKEYPNTKFEYYKGEKVLIKTAILGCSTLLTINKPGTYLGYRGYCKCPVVKMSMNGSAMIHNGSFQTLQLLVEKGIEILNSENVGIIQKSDINNFNLGNIQQKVKYINKEKDANTVKCIHQSKLKIGGIYKEANGRLSIYFGNSHLYNQNYDGNYTHSNKKDCMNIYGSEALLDIIKRGMSVIQQEITCGSIKAKLYNVVVSDFHTLSNYIDSYKTPRRFIEEVDTLHIPESARFINVRSENSYLGVNNNCQSSLIIKRNTKDNNVQIIPDTTFNQDIISGMIFMAERG